MIIYAVARLTLQQKADLILNYLKTHGPSNYKTICEGTVPQMTYNQFVGGLDYINHTMQTVWGLPFGCMPGTNLYQFPDLWVDNMHIVVADLKYVRTRTHKLASNLTASLQKAKPGKPWAADFAEIEDLAIAASRLYEDFDRKLKR